MRRKEMIPAVQYYRVCISRLTLSRLIVIHLSLFYRVFEYYLRGIPTNILCNILIFFFFYTFYYTTIIYA
jgi:hypothetical protein